MLARTLVTQGVKTGQVDAVQPVRALPGQGRMREPTELAVVFGRLDGPGYGRGRQVIDQYPLDRRLGANVPNDLVYQQLTFPVRVARVNNRCGLPDKRLKHL